MLTTLPSSSLISFPVSEMTYTVSSGTLNPSIPFWSASSRQCPPINVFAAVLGLSYHGPRQNSKTGDVPSKILIDSGQVEGVEEFIYIGSKQSSNGYCRPDVLRRIGLACSVMNFSTEVMELQFSQYQHQSSPVPSTDKVCSALRYWNIDPLGRRHEYRVYYTRYYTYSGGFPHEVSATDT